ncbi:MAG: carbohydrate kinase family protein [Patescibacteria group bacterium]
MLKDKISQIAVSGSIAFDKIMDFPGIFSDNIVLGKPNQFHQLNLSLIVDNLKTSFGGTAGNIAYNLSLLKEKPIVFGTVGFDFLPYRAWMLKNKLNLEFIKERKLHSTATAHIITDKNDNQVSAFYPCPYIPNYATKAVTLACRKYNIKLAIIAPDNKEMMLQYARAYRARKIPFIFDSGQAVHAFSPKELREAIVNAEVLIGNDYEMNFISQSLKMSIADLSNKVKTLIITKGSKGSEIYQSGHKIIVKSAKPANSSDPTGAGDAYRAGLIKGLIKGYNLKTCGRLAGTVSVYTVEKYGTQTHSFTIKDLQKRYYKNFKEKINL